MLNSDTGVKECPGISSHIILTGVFDNARMLNQGFTAG